MPWLYRALADVVVVVHAAYVGFVIVAMLLILLGIVCGWQWIRNFWFRAIHILLIGVVVAESLLGIVCPLTTWEFQLRTAAGQQAEEGSFVGRWAHWLLFYDAPEWVFTTIYCAFGAVVLITMIFVPPRWPFRPSRKRPNPTSPI